MTEHKCTECGKFARRKKYGLFYCTECYIINLFRCKNVHSYVNQEKIFHMHSAIDNHIILRNTVASVLELCTLLDIDYWFGKGRLGGTDMSNYLHIDDVKSGKNA